MKVRCTRRGAARVRAAITSVDAARLDAARSRILAVSDATAKRVAAAMSDADAVAACVSAGHARANVRAFECACDGRLARLPRRRVDVDVRSRWGRATRAVFVTSWISDAHRCDFCARVGTLRVALAAGLSHHDAAVQAARDGSLACLRFLADSGVVAADDASCLRIVDPLAAAAGAGHLACLDALAPSPPCEASLLPAICAALDGGREDCFARLTSDGPGGLGAALDAAGAWRVLNRAVYAGSRDGARLVERLALARFGEGWRAPRFIADAAIAPTMSDAYAGAVAADAFARCAAVDAFLAGAASPASLSGAKARLP